MVLISWDAANAIETPKYAVLESLSDSVEVRRYSQFTLARVKTVDVESNSDNRSFRTLAGYIFGANSTGEKIAMTAPVAQTMDGGKAKDMAFFLPEGLAVPPKPDSERVKIAKAEMTVAVITYRGGWGVRKFEKAKRDLEKVLLSQENWKIMGKPIWARYNSPFSIPALRRNEVFIPVARY